MIKINHKMEPMIQWFSCEDQDLIMKKVDELSSVVFSKIKEIDQKMVVMDFDDSLMDNMLDYEWILSTFKDLTGYEANCNKMRFSDFIVLDGISIYPFSVNFLNRLRKEITTKYPKYHFTIILQLLKEDAEIRFHLTREDEQAWLVDNLDTYNESLLVCTT